MGLCHHRFFIHNRDGGFLTFLPLRTLHDGTVRLGALVFISVLSVLKCCPSVLDTTGIGDLPRTCRNSSYLMLLVKNLPPLVCCC
jgi:hypothetical protein